MDYLKEALAVGFNKKIAEIEEDTGQAYTGLRFLSGIDWLLGYGTIAYNDSIDYLGDAGYDITGLQHVNQLSDFNVEQIYYKLMEVFEQELPEPEPESDPEPDPEPDPEV